MKGRMDNMKKEFYRLMLGLTNNSFYNSIIKEFTNKRVSKILIPSFSKTFGINAEELARPYSDYKSLSDFFSRELKEGARQLSEMENDVVSPVDGVISEAGTVTEDMSFPVKGKKHSLKTMLGLEEAVNRYAGGEYCVFYLSPKDYHRIHAPYYGTVLRRWALGKYSEPVNALGFHFGKEPLATNYRLVTEMKHDGGRMAIVKVGALNVNSIHPVHVDKAVVEKGREMAYFSFGSSVVLLFEPGTVAIKEELKGKVTPVKQGETIGVWRG
ncbi:phosphatidylserine decarboxylase [Salipaludibacillus sp. CUR1]|uniref:phosphatidylserine decarboxylase n=1 Tax=Salipaludibacillus sp. CUR1 TaxID=2820003 RepID=UPI001E5C3A1A|nr:phosphatidylserine decarboxylase [Salipaludibacillus sp. CUR1]MCE7794161.1 phosphatidylserine decarboxylase [Salipaludibacillus sp. CUR1]